MLRSEVTYAIRNGERCSTIRCNPVNVPFWICLYNVPFGHRSNKTIRPIISSLANAMEIEDDFLEIEPYFKVSVLLDINKLLRKMQKVRVKGENTVKVPIKYERLPHFGFYCGLMSHADRDCNIVKEEDVEKGCSLGT